MTSKLSILIGRNRSKDGKALVNNFKYLMLLQVAGYVFPLITLPYLARVIGVEGFGKIAFATAVVIWLKTISDWGFNYTATRDVAKHRNNPKIVSEIFSNVLWAKAGLMVASFVFLIVAISIVPYFKENKELLLVTFLLVPGNILFPEWFFQAMERMKFITIFNLASKFFFTILVFVFIKEKSDYILQPFFVFLGYAVSGVIAMYIIIVRWKVRVFYPDYRVIWTTIKGSTNVFINNFMPNLYHGFSTILLGFWGGVISVGMLDAGRKFLGIADQFLAVLSRVFFPFLSRRADKHGAYARIHMSVAFFVFLILFILSPYLIKIFFTEEFYPAISVLQISAFSILFLSLRNVYGTNYLIVRGYDRDSKNIMVYTSIFGFLLSFPFVYLFDFKGAAMLVVLIHASQGICMMAKSLKIERSLA